MPLLSTCVPFLGICVIRVAVPFLFELECSLLSGMRRYQRSSDGSRAAGKNIWTPASRPVTRSIVCAVGVRNTCYPCCSLAHRGCY